MPIAADPFAAPRAIGQGLTGIVAPDYTTEGATSDAGQGAQQAAAGPFAPLTGALGETADKTREGLSALLSVGRGTSSGLDAMSSGMPLSTLGLPMLGGSPVSTGGAAASRAPTASSLSGLARMFGLPDMGGTAAGGNSFSPDFSLQGMQAALNSLQSPTGIANNLGRAMALFAGPFAPLVSLGKMGITAGLTGKVRAAQQALARALDEERDQGTPEMPGPPGPADPNTPTGLEGLASGPTGTAGTPGAGNTGSGTGTGAGDPSAGGEGGTAGDASATGGFVIGRPGQNPAADSVPMRLQKGEVIVPRGVLANQLERAFQFPLKTGLGRLMRP